MEVAILELIKLIPQGASAFVSILLILYFIYTKNKDQSVNQATAIGKLQTDQLSTLINQNVQLAEELHSVREELTQAYGMINDMRERISELEHLLKERQK